MFDDDPFFTVDKDNSDDQYVLMNNGTKNRFFSNHLKIDGMQSIQNLIEVYSSGKEEGFKQFTCQFAPPGSHICKQKLNYDVNAKILTARDKKGFKISQEIQIITCTS